MKISVIIPVYNTGKYLSECLDSVLAQTYSDLEVIVVDDGSTDNSPQIIDKYAKEDNRIKVLHQSNKGASAARNYAIAESTGDYIVFVDSDDMMDHRMIAHLLGLMSRTGAAAAFADFTRESKDELSTKGRIIKYTPKEAIEYTLYQRGLNNSLSGKILPAEAVKQTRQDVGRIYEDLSVFYKIYENIQGDIIATTAPLYYYRRNAESCMSNFTVSRLDVLTVTEEIERHYADDPVLLKAARDRRFSANYNMAILASGASMHHAAERCWNLIKKYRASALLNPRTRSKNKMGALLSYFGLNNVLRVAKRMGYDVN